MKADEVHLWRAALGRPRAEIVHLQTMLSPDEHSRAERFRFPVDRDDFIVARAFLRAILGYYLGCPGAAIRFQYGEQGQPVLAGDTGGSDLRFSLSHAKGIALYAVARGRRVGVDVESIDPDPVDEWVAGRYFLPLESARLRALPPQERSVAFFRVWTRKEAYLKALGEGLSGLPAASESRPEDNEPATAAHPGPAAGPGPESRWVFRELDAGPGYVGALVVEGAGWRLIERSWPLAETGERKRSQP